MDKIKLTINGKEIETEKGKTVLEVAIESGIEIPVFCYHPCLKSIGACRICLVEIEKWPKLQVSCATTAGDGMVVFTESEKVIKARQGVLEFILANHPLDCPTCDKGGECPLQNTTFKYGLDFSRFEERKRRFIKEENSTFDDLKIGPEIIRNQNRCIHCYRCTRLTDERFFEHDLGSYNRGAFTEILPPPGGEIRNLYSSNVVEYCPVGALTNSDWRYKVRVWKTFNVPSICGFCSDGCNLNVTVGRKKIQRGLARPNFSIDEGLPCDIGRYGVHYVHHDDRLTVPMIKKDGDLVECSWNEAFAAIKEKIDKTVSSLGPQGVACLVGENLSNEDYFSIGRFFKSVIGTNSIDHRLNRKKKLSFSDDIIRRELCENKLDINDLEKCKTIFVIGSDLHTENPITSLRILKAKRYSGAKILLTNPRQTQLNRAADHELVYKTYSELSLLQGLARLIIEKKLYNSETVRLDKKEIDSFLADTKDYAIGNVSQVTGLNIEELEKLAQSLCESDSTAFIAGETVRTHYQRDPILIALFNLARITGNLSGKNCGILLLGGESNTKGCYRMGMRPDCLPYNIALKDAAKITEIWGDGLSDQDGYDTIDILQKINEEKIECGFLIGIDAANKFPDHEYISTTLAKLDFLVVADLFLTDTARLADVVLPLTSHFETDGTFINWEGTLQKFSKAIANVGDSMPSWKIFSWLSKHLEKDFEYRCADDIFKQFASLIPCDDILELNDLPSDGLRFEKNKTYPEIGVYAINHRAPNFDDYPLTVLSGNGDHHFSRNYSTRSESLNKFLADPYIAINPKVATEMSISDGDLIKLENSAGKIVANALILQNLPEDVVFIPDNFPEVKANMLRNKEFDIDRAKLVKM
jgi:formate dehydrogenase (NADP+) alpha subunit